MTEPWQLVAVFGFIALVGAWISFRRHNMHVRSRRQASQGRNRG